MRTKKLPKELKIVKYGNPEIIRSKYTFAYERFDQPKLVQLRRRHKLDEVVNPVRCSLSNGVKDAKSEFEKFVLLRDWVKSRWAHGWDESKATDLSDGLAILEDAERGLEFCCGTYALLFVQCVLSLGYQARRLSISKIESDFITPDEGNVGHSVPEVWSNEFGKWVIMDPDINAHYEHKGIPLSAYEIRDFWLKGKWQEVKLVRGKSPFVHSQKPPKIWAKEGMERVEREFDKFMRYNTMDYYHYLAVEMGNDYFSSKKDKAKVGWVDEFSPPRLVRCNVAVQHPQTQNLSDLYWTLNQTHITLRCAGRDSSQPTPLLKVELETVTPNFDRFLVKIDDGKWRTRPATFKWRLKEGDNTIRAKSINKFGIEGIESMITVRYRR